MNYVREFLTRQRLNILPLGLTANTTVPYTTILVAGILLVCIVIAIVVFTVYRTTPPSLHKGPITLFSPASPVVVDRTTVRKLFQNTYSLSFYIHIDAVPDVRMSATPILTWPGVWDLNYNAAKEELEWKFRTSAVESSNGNTVDSIVFVPRIPLQKWMQIAITFEGRTADIYANGKLVRSSTLTNVPPIPNASITIVPGGAKGEIAYIQSWKERRRVSEIQSNYYETSDSQGRPLLGTDFFKGFKGFTLPNLLCPGGDCAGKTPAAAPTKKWDFPYA